MVRVGGFKDLEEKIKDFIVRNWGSNDYDEWFSEFVVRIGRFRDLEEKIEDFVVRNWGSNDFDEWFSEFEWKILWFILRI